MMQYYAHIILCFSTMWQYLELGCMRESLFQSFKFVAAEPRGNVAAWPRGCKYNSCQFTLMAAWLHCRKVLFSENILYLFLCVTLTCCIAKVIHSCDPNGDRVYKNYKDYYICNIWLKWLLEKYGNLSINVWKYYKGK